jgi:predicted PurR-regulated permease PerM
MQSNIWNLDPDVDTSKFNDIELKRNICVCGIIVSVIGVIICCIILYGKSTKTGQIIIKTQHINNSTQSKLHELEQIYKDNLITQEEYDNKKKEILDKL